MRQNVLLYDPTRERKIRLSITDIPADLDWLHRKRKKIRRKSYFIYNEKRVPADSATKITKLKSFFYRYGQGFWFSVYVFTKIGYVGVYARGKTRYAVIFEWIFGYGFESKSSSRCVQW